MLKHIKIGVAHFAAGSLYLPVSSYRYPRFFTLTFSLKWTPSRLFKMFLLKTVLADELKRGRTGCESARRCPADGGISRVMSASGQRVAENRSGSQAPNVLQIYPCNYGMKLHKCKDD